MEEKKLTDEEIVKALDCCASCNITQCAECPMRKDCVKNDFSGVNLSLVLDLIHRLQDKEKELQESADLLNDFNEKLNGIIEGQKVEIERLTEEANQDTVTHIDLCTENLSLRKQNTELQKQVDELADKLGKVLSTVGIDEYQQSKAVEQAVKDTADKIFRQVLRLYQGLSKAEKETMTFEWKLLDLAVEYGVEVE